MAHIKKTYLISKELANKGFATLLIDNFEKECENTRIKIIQKTSTYITFKGPLFRFTAEKFHYLNGITCGKLEVFDQPNALKLERTFCYKEVVLICLVFTLLPVFAFLSPLYQYQLTDTILLTHKMIAGILLFVIWGVVFLGNVIFTSLRFSQFVSSTKKKVISNVK